MNKATKAASDWLESDFELRAVAQDFACGLMSTGEGEGAVVHAIENLLKKAAGNSDLSNPFMHRLFVYGFGNIDFRHVARPYIGAYASLFYGGLKTK